MKDQEICKVKTIAVSVYFFGNETVPELCNRGYVSVSIDDDYDIYSGTVTAEEALELANGITKAAAIARQYDLEMAEAHAN